MSDVEKDLIARGQALHAEFFLPTRSKQTIFCNCSLAMALTNRHVELLLCWHESQHVVLPSLVHELHSSFTVPNAQPRSQALSPCVYSCTYNNSSA